ncbi:MAG: ABC transporter ATP-binding protein [Thermomicrobiales bacterium]
MTGLNGRVPTVAAASATEPAIAVRGLTKRYGAIEALRGVELTVPRGALFGLVGPNGAGKTTLIKALVGALRPSGGEVRVLGADPLRDRARVRQQIGYMPQAPALYDDLSARDNIAFFAAAHAVPDLAARVTEVLAFTELTERADDSIASFSGGMRRRVSLAAALVHRPTLLLLDEPTAAVDPALRTRFWQQFRALAAAGATLFISTHLMDEALLCDQIAMLYAGRIIACDAPQRLLERGHTRLTVREDGRDETVVIGSRPEDLAGALHPYGLAPDVQAVTLAADSLETVLLTLIEQQDRTMYEQAGVR